MELLVIVLQRYFSMTREMANRSMLESPPRRHGCICGISPARRCDTKVEAGGRYARKHQHRYMCHGET